MAEEKKKAGGRPFKPGQSGNPNGRPKTPPEVKAAQTLGKNEFTRIVNKYLWLEPTSFELMASAPSTMFEKAVAAQVARAAAGDEKSLELILTRLLGRPREKMELTLPKPFVVFNADGAPVAELGAKMPEPD